MHVVSEEGDYSYVKPTKTIYDVVPETDHESQGSHHHHTSANGKTPSMAVCGLFVVTDPDKNVEITIKYLNVNCESGGLMSVSKMLINKKMLMIFIYILSQYIVCGWMGIKWTIFSQCSRTFFGFG